MKQKLPVLLSGAALILSAVLFQNCAKNADSTDFSSASATDYSYSLANAQEGFLGEIDASEYYNGKLYVRGWLCKVGSDEAAIGYGARIRYIWISYSGELSTTPIVANLPGEAAIAEKCQSSHGNHRYNVALDFPSIDQHEVFALKNDTGENFNSYIAKNKIKFLTEPPATVPAPAPAPGPAPAPNPEASTRVIGVVDEAREDQGQLLIRGWSCSIGNEGPIPVHFYAGGAGVGVLVTAVPAEVERESEVAMACGTASKMHGFEIRLTAQQRSQFQGKTIYVYGINPSPNGVNPDLVNNGKFVIF